MNNFKKSSYTLSEMKDKYIGSIETKSRKQYEYRLAKAVLIRKVFSKF